MYIKAKIIEHTSMGVAIEYGDWKGLLLLDPHFKKKHLLLPNQFILCKIVRISKQSFDAKLIKVI